MKSLYAKLKRRYFSSIRCLPRSRQSLGEGTLQGASHLIFRHELFTIVLTHRSHVDVDMRETLKLRRFSKEAIALTSALQYMLEKLREISLSLGNLHRAGKME